MTYIAGTAHDIAKQIRGQWQEVKEGESLSALYQHAQSEHVASVDSKDLINTQTMEARQTIKSIEQTQHKI